MLQWYIFTSRRNNSLSVVGFFHKIDIKGFIVDTTLTWKCDGHGDPLVPLASNESSLTVSRHVRLRCIKMPPRAGDVLSLFTKGPRSEAEVVRFHL